MPSIRTLLAFLFVGGAMACGAELIAPSPLALAGRWNRIPSGRYSRTLELTADGRYVQTSTFRGDYPQLPRDSAGTIVWEYGRYVVHDDTLRFAQDSLRSWDWMSGYYFQIGIGREGMSIEGPPTDPTIELTSTRLTLRYMVNPGAGYVPVVDEYLRSR
jgi:hypothetical protein